jgi:CPA1 family monovalent cation:H+ antiporter
MRDLIVLTAFSVVLGTLLIQGLTLGAVLRALNLRDGDPVAEELHAAREGVLQAALSVVPGGVSHAEDVVRKAFTVRLAPASTDALRADKLAAYQDAYRTALRSARRALLEMRDRGDIGDDAFHALENDLDWMEVSNPIRSASEDEPSGRG